VVDFFYDFLYVPSLKEFHLLLIVVCFNISLDLGLGPLWDKDLVGDFFYDFFYVSSLKEFHFLPIVVIWGLWLAKNAGLFEYK